jgi:Ni,Fe-hydrogenase III large subunit
MTPIHAYVPVSNGGSAPLSTVPRLQPDSFAEAIMATPGARLVSFFGLPEESRGLRLIAVLARPGDATLLVTSAHVEGVYPALTPRWSQAHLFEREIHEEWGVRPEGHPWLKPVRFLGATSRDPGVMDYFEVEGEEVHEVAVGPVHAGVIEPGHFRFQCHGERVLHLEISLGYQHRGIERALEGAPGKRTMHVVDAIAGDTSVGHACAYSQIVESLAGIEVPARGHALRAIALELERVANHAGDLGALAGDIGYLPAASYCGRIRGDFLNLTLDACGSRMGVGWVRPGGVAADLAPARANAMADTVARGTAELRRSFDLIRGNTTVRARLEETGILAREVAEELGMVGPAARASGLDRDVRRDHPMGHYREVELPIATRETGDVFARAGVRSLEVAHSADFLARALRSLPSGAARRNDSESLPPLAPERIAVSLVEGWRGEICHTAITDDQGRIRRYKVVDPSFHNWMGLAMAMRDQPISDFPLCNKSFNLSYSGHDL